MTVGQEAVQHCISLGRPLKQVSSPFPNPVSPCPMPPLSPLAHAAPGGIPNTWVEAKEMAPEVRAPEDWLSQSPQSIAGSRFPSHPCPTVLAISHLSRAWKKKVACPWEGAGR